MRIVLTSLCLFCVAASIWLGIMENVLRHPGFLGRTLIAAFIALQSGAAIFGISAPRSFGWRVVMMMGSVAVFAIGINALMKVTNAPHFEGYAAVIGFACVLQGIFTLLLFSGHGRAHRHPGWGIS